MKTHLRLNGTISEVLDYGTPYPAYHRACNQKDFWSKKIKTETFRRQLVTCGNCKRTKAYGSHP